MESFLKEKAVDNTARGLGRTYLFLDIQKDSIKIVAYFTVALKVLKLKDDLSNTLKKKIAGTNTETAEVAGYLIGQIGKDSGNPVSGGISGDALLNFAENIILEAHDRVGGRIIFLECEDTKSLTDLYIRNDYKEIPRTGEDASSLLLFVKNIK